jgi:hypothetical protein
MAAPREVAYDTARRRHARPGHRVPFISMARTRELIDSAANAHAAVGSSQLKRAAGAPFSAIMGWRAKKKAAPREVTRNAEAACGPVQLLVWPVAR